MQATVYEFTHKSGTDGSDLQGNSITQRHLNYSKATQLLNAVAEGECVLAEPRDHASRLGRSSARRSCPVGEALEGMPAFVQSGLCFRAAKELMPLFFTDHAFLAHGRRVDDDQYRRNAAGSV
jgi:hypothetical protein